MTVEEIIEEIDNEFQKENGYWLSTAIPIEFAAQVAIKFAKLKCAEQRTICADNAEMIIEIIGEDEPISVTGSHYANADDFIKLNKDSILNSPMPEI